MTNTATLVNKEAEGQAPYSYGWWDIATGKARTSAAQTQFNASMQEASQNFNAEEAQKARDFEEYMSNTAYQRAMQDAKKAGINILNTSAQQASTPSGASASAGATTAMNSGSNGAGTLILGTAKIIAGIITANPKITTSGLTDYLKNIGANKDERDLTLRLINNIKKR